VVRYFEIQRTDGFAGVRRAHRPFRTPHRVSRMADPASRSAANLAITAALRRLVALRGRRPGVPFSCEL
jgi:hypothetical protein